MKILDYAMWFVSLETLKQNDLVISFNLQLPTRLLW